MKKIIYKNTNEVENFDMKRFLASLAKYAKVSEKDAKEGGIFRDHGYEMIDLLFEK